MNCKVTKILFIGKLFLTLRSNLNLLFIYYKNEQRKQFSAKRKQ